MTETPTTPAFTPVDDERFELLADTETVAPLALPLLTAGELRLSTAAAVGVKRTNIFQRSWSSVTRVTSDRPKRPRSHRAPAFYEDSLMRREMYRL